MRRNEIKTGELIAWADSKSGPSLPGIAIGPIPVSRSYNDTYRKRDTGQEYLFMIPIGWRDDGKAIKRALNISVDAGEEPDFDHGVRGAVNATLAMLETGERFASADLPIPPGWGLRAVASQMLRGPYPQFRAIDVAKSKRTEELRQARERGWASNSARFARIQERLLARSLPSGMTDRVDFHEFQPSGENPLVEVPLSLLELLVDDGDR